MNKAFPLFLWENAPSVNTPLGQTLLNKVNIGLSEVDDRVIVLNTTKANQTEMLTAIDGVSLDTETGVLTFYRKNGATIVLDTGLAKTAINLDLDEDTQQFVLYLADGTKKRIDVSAFIAQTEFVESGTTYWTVSSDGKVQVDIKKGSITADMLEPNYLANVQLYASNALESANNAKTSEENAKASEEKAKEYMEQAQQADIASLVNGTIPAGDSLLLNGLTAEEFVSNENLLINGYFPDAVNSSGKTEWTSTGTTIDKWVKSNSNATVALTDDGLVITFTGSSYFQLVQEIINWENLLGKTITISAKANGTVYSKTLTLPATAEKTIDTTELALPYGYIDLYKQTNQPNLQLRYIMSTTVGNSITFEYIKLELSNIATPFIPPNKEVEKLKCGVADADTVDDKHASDFVTNTNDYGWSVKNFGTYDINTWIKDGCYGYSGDCLNKPHGDWGTIFVMSPNSTKIMQFGYDWNEANQPLRSRVSNDGGITWSEWDYLNAGVLVNYLPLDGSVSMRGDLRVRKSGSTTARIVAINDLGQIGMIVNSDGSYGLWDYQTGRYLLGIQADGNIVMEGNRPLHTGNKPTGSYTGNGDATARTIDTGGIGNAILLWMGNGNILVGPRGGVGNFYNSAHMLFSKDELKFENGILTIATSNLDVNADGFTVNYQVL